VLAAAHRLGPGAVDRRDGEKFLAAIAALAFLAALPWSRSDPFLPSQGSHSATSLKGASMSFDFWADNGSTTPLVGAGDLRGRFAGAHSNRPLVRRDGDGSCSSASRRGSGLVTPWYRLLDQDFHSLIRSALLRAQGGRDGCWRVLTCLWLHAAWQNGPPPEISFHLRLRAVGAALLWLAWRCPPYRRTALPAIVG